MNTAELGSLLPAGGLAGFHDVDATGPEATAYVGFLDAFQRSQAPMIEAGLDALALAPGDTVLDVGCGSGAAFGRLAARIGAAGRIVGLDASRALLAEAQRRVDAGPLGATRVELHAGDAHRLPFADGGFDAARADRVLVFLSEPERALDEMIRVVRPGGRIAVTEADFGSAIVDADDEAVTRTVMSAAAGRMSNPALGRRLRRLFVEHGLSDVAVRCSAVQSTRLDEWTHRLGLLPALERVAASGGVEAGALKAWRDTLEARQAAGAFYAVSFLFTATGTVPATPLTRRASGR